MRDFADDNPHVDVTLLRFANVLGDDIDTPFAVALRRPIVPEIFGFDPRVQFVHEDDVVEALVYSTTNDIPGVYNVAGDGKHAVERGVHDRAQAPLADPVRAHEPRVRAGATVADLGSAARGPRAVALRPLTRQRPVTSGRDSGTPTPLQQRSRRSRRVCG